MFIGRQHDLSRLWTSLRPQPLPTRRRVAVVHGPDGIGKSRLAAHFSELHKGDFCSIWLVHGKDKNSVLASLAALASRLPTDETTSTLGNDAPRKSSTLEEQASMVLEWLSREENPQWLLVFDDAVADLDPSSAETGSSSDAYSICDFFPRSDHGSILVTTTEPNMNGVGEAHALSKLSPHESLEFFDLGTKSRTKNGLAGHVEDSAGKLLVHQLDGLPLALIQAASYMNQTGQNISSYLELFQDMRQALRETTEHECDSTVVTCALSFRQIQQSNPLAAKLLLLLSCYNNTGISAGLLEYGYDNLALPEWLGSSRSLEDRYAKELQTLSDFSLITPQGNDTGAYSMHPVVKNWCRHSMVAEQKEEINTAALILLGTATTEASTSEGSPVGNRQSLLPHADEMRRILQNNGELVSTSEQSLLAIRKLGSLYKNQGCLAHAEDMYLCALSRAQEFFGSSHPFTRQINKELRRLRFMKGPLWKRFGSSRSATAILVIFEVCIAVVEYSVHIATFFLTVLSILFAPFL